MKILICADNFKLFWAYNFGSSIFHFYVILLLKTRQKIILLVLFLLQLFVWLFDVAPVLVNVISLIQLFPCNFRNFSDKIYPKHWKRQLCFSFLIVNAIGLHTETEFYLPKIFIANIRLFRVWQTRSKTSLSPQNQCLILHSYIKSFFCISKHMILRKQMRALKML